MSPRQWFCLGLYAALSVVLAIILAVALAPLMVLP